MARIIRPGALRDKDLRVKVMFPEDDSGGICGGRWNSEAVIPQTPPPIRLPAAARQAQPWVNGQGVTTPVTCGPATGPGAQPLWWVNIARIPGDCDFSELVGIDRLFMPLEDVPLTLDLDGPRAAAYLEVIGFAGEMAPRCTAAGPTRALNLMLRRGRAAGHLSAVEVRRRLELPVPPAGTLVVVVLDGAVAWPGGPELRPGDAVRQDAGPGAEHFALDGQGRVAVISIF